MAKNNNNNKPTLFEGDLSHVNQVIELEAEKPRKIMIEVKVKDMGLYGDEEDCQDGIEPVPPPNTSGTPRISDMDHRPKPDEKVPDNNVPKAEDTSMSYQSPQEEPDAIISASATDASFKRLLGQWVPQNDEKCLRQHFYRYGPPPPVVPLPVAPTSSAKPPTDRLTTVVYQVPENSAILPENERKKEVFKKPPSQTDDVLELEKELIRSYTRLDPSKIKANL